MSSNHDDDVDEVCVEEMSSKDTSQIKTATAPEADNASIITGCLIITIGISLLYYGGCHVITFFTGGSMGATTTLEEINLDKRSFIGKTIAVSGEISDIWNPLEDNRIRIQMYGSIGVLDFIIRNEDVKKRFRAAKPEKWDEITMKGEICMYSNDFELYMEVEDFEY